MKKIISLRLVWAAGSFLAGALLVLAWTAGSAAGGDPPQAPDMAPVGTAFTYQGVLEESGHPANGSYDFQFWLYDAITQGNQVGITATLGDILVEKGLFSVDLDFGGSAFAGGKRWLEIAVRAGSSTGAYSVLNPRQPVSPSPVAQSLPNVYSNESTNFVGIGRDFRISGNEVFGVRFDGSANQYGGMYVETSNAGGWPFYGYATNGAFRAWTYYNGTRGEWSLYNAGVRLKVPSTGGLRIGPSQDYSLVISNTTGSDGIRVLDTGDDSIQIGNFPDISNYGVYIPNPGVTNYGIWSNTANALHEWAFYSIDNIQAGNVFASAYSLIARVSGTNPLSAGDLAAVTGMAEPIPGSDQSLPQVQIADAVNNGVLGVVTSRMVLAPAPGKEAEDAMSLQSAEGPAQPGDYVSLIIFGVAQVKVEPGASIIAGERLTASQTAGRARPLITQQLNGMTVVEGAPVIGVALEASAQDQDTIPVFVNPR